MAPSVLGVTGPFSYVNVVTEVVFSDSDCDIVELQTLSISRKLEAFFVEVEKT